MFQGKKKKCMKMDTFTKDEPGGKNRDNRYVLLLPSLWW
jgi:hypothetical protein